MDEQRKTDGGDENMLQFQNFNSQDKNIVYCALCHLAAPNTVWSELGLVSQRLACNVVTGK